MSSKEDIIYKTSKYFKEKRIILPKISELTEPHSINQDIQNQLKLIDKNDINPLNLFRVHWYNNLDHTEFAKIRDELIEGTNVINEQNLSAFVPKK